MMKKSFFILILLIFSINVLNARSNPFEPTSTYNEELEALKNPPKTVANLVKDIKIEKIAQQKQQPIIKNKIVKKIIKPKEEIIFKKPIKIVLKDKTINKNVCTKQIKIYKYNLLPFVDIKIVEDIMYVKTDYILKEHFNLKEENKIVFDYSKKKRFYTKRETLSSHKDFNKIIIGAHPKKSYFRVVIQTKDDISNYKIKIDKKDLVSIKRIRNNSN